MDANFVTINTSILYIYLYSFIKSLISIPWAFETVSLISSRNLFKSTIIKKSILNTGINTRVCYSDLPLNSRSMVWSGLREKSGSGSNLEGKTGSGSDLTGKTGSGSDHILKIGSGSHLISKNRIRIEPYFDPDPASFQKLDRIRMRGF